MTRFEHVACESHIKFERKRSCRLALGMRKLADCRRLRGRQNGLSQTEICRCRADMSSSCHYQQSLIFFLRKCLLSLLSVVTGTGRAVVQTRISNGKNWRSAESVEAHKMNELSKTYICWNSPTPLHRPLRSDAAVTSP